MIQKEKETVPLTKKTNNSTSVDGPSLLARYGDDLESNLLSDEQKQEFLIALHRIMAAFVDLGFSVKSGDRFSEQHDFGMDDVLKYVHFEDTAHETVAPRLTPNAEEH